MKDPKITSNGLLGEGDLVSLSPGLSVEGAVLHDTAINANHQLDPAAVPLLQAFETGIVYGKWLLLAKNRLTSEDESYEIIEFLNSIGGLHIHRGLVGWVEIRVFFFKRLLYGIRNSQHTERYSLSFINLCYATLRAMMLLFLAALAVGILLNGAGIGARVIILSLVGFYVAVFASIVLHELMHVWFVGKNPGAIIRQGTRIGILHTPLTTSREYASAVLGPIVGGVIGFGICLVFERIVGLPFFVQTGYMLLAAHAWSWSPGYGDGKILLNRKAV